MTPATERLSALDGTFLELEDADPCAHMHIGSIMIFGALPRGGTPTLAAMRAHVEERLDAIPRYRRRLAGTGPGVITWQHWEPDPHFDVARHVHAATLPAPGGWEELLEWAGDYFSARLDRTMPLWHMTLVEGLAKGHWALVTKTHHCLVDGVGSVAAAHALVDDGGGAAPAPGPEAHTSRLDPLVHTVQAGLHLAAHPRDLAHRAEALGALAFRDEVVAAPASSLNAPIGPRRLLRGVAVDLEEVRHIRKVLGGTVNDVLLAGACGGLRALLLARGEELPYRGLRAMVPLNVRREGEELGNRVSSLFVELPVAEPGPVDRYARIRETTAAIKRSSQPLGADSLLRLSELAPPVVHGYLAQALFGKRLFNLTVTNVPGPPERLTAFGAPLETVWPLVPIASDHAVGLAIVSYAGQLMYGICADRDSVPDVDVLATGIADTLAALRRHAAPTA